MTARCLDPLATRDAGDDERGVAAMEFAIIAPIMLLLLWGVWDVSRALLAWEETFHAAEAIAQAGEKLSYSGQTYPSSTKPLTMLSSTEMQDAMSSIYAEMPWLNLGTPPALFGGPYQVTLSGIVYTPTCQAGSVCGLQVPFVIWSSYLTEGGTDLVQPNANNPNTLYRQCGLITPVAQFPNNNTQLKVMIDPDLVPGGTHNMILIPQVVADVVTNFTPTFPLLSGFSYTFYASATFPAPVGGDDQAIVFDQKDSGANSVENCPGGNPFNG